MFKNVNDYEVSLMRRNLSYLARIYKTKLNMRKSDVQRIIHEEVTTDEFNSVLSKYEISKLRKEEIKILFGQDFVIKMDAYIERFINEICGTAGIKDKINSNDINTFDQAMNYILNRSLIVDKIGETELIKSIDDMICKFLYGYYGFTSQQIMEIDKLKIGYCTLEDDDLDVDYDQFAQAYMLSEFLDFLAETFNRKGESVYEGSLIISEDEDQRIFLKKEYDWIRDQIDDESLEKEGSDFSLADYHGCEPNQVAYLVGKVDGRILSLLQSIEPGYQNAYDYIENYMYTDVINYKGQDLDVIKWSFNDGMLAYGLPSFGISALLLMYGGKKNEN